MVSPVTFGTIYRTNKCNLVLPLQVATWPVQAHRLVDNSCSGSGMRVRKRGMYLTISPALKLSDLL